MVFALASQWNSQLIILARSTFQNDENFPALNEGHL